jgi:transcriptional regulator with XRE-family HTH domain
MSALQPSTNPTEIIVGLKIREVRNQRGFTLRTLAERSGLNINTLSLVENGKTSPSVGTLQQLARALEVSITAFFESERVLKQVVFTDHRDKNEVVFNKAHMQNLGKDLSGNAVQPFLVTLEAGAVSGEQKIEHTGHEFVYCLLGKILYMVDDIEYSLEAGDSIVFESQLPHRWKNIAEAQSQIILVFYPTERHEELEGKHFIK